MMNRLHLQAASGVVMLVVAVFGFTIGLSGQFRLEGAAGDPDPGFGTNGIVRLPQVAAANDGRIVELANKQVVIAMPGVGFGADRFTTTVTLVRLNGDGSPDLTLGGSGIAQVDVVGLEMPATVLTLDDGSVILTTIGQTVPMTYPTTLSIRRIAPDGRVDPTFVGGRLTIPLFLSNFPELQIAKRLNSGRTLVALYGSEFPPEAFLGRNPNVPVVRTFLFSADGLPDPANGVNGIRDLRLSPNRQWDSMRGLALSPDDGLVAYGSVPYSGEDTDLAILRFRPDGTPDPSFGANGEVVLDLERGRDSVAAIGFQSDGTMITVVDSLTIDRRRQSARYLMRFLRDGTLDPTFGAAGRVAISHPPGTAGPPVARMLQVFPDDSITLLDQVRVTDCIWQQTAVLVTRWTREGLLDHAFGRTGVAQIRLPTTTFEIWDTRFDQAGHPLLLGRPSPGPPTSVPFDTRITVLRATGSGAVTDQPSPFRLFIPTNRSCVPYRSPNLPPSVGFATRPTVTLAAP